MRLASRASRWLRIIADRQEISVSAVCRDLHTAPNLAREVVRVLDHIARDEALALLDGKKPKPLPADTDWLTKHYYMTIKAARDESSAKEQDALAEQYMKAQGGTP